MAFAFFHQRDLLLSGMPKGRRTEGVPCAAAGLRVSLDFTE